LGNTLETFDCDRLPNPNRTHIHDLVTGRCIDEIVAVLIDGATAPANHIWPRHLAMALSARDAGTLDVVFA